MFTFFSPYLFSVFVAVTFCTRISATKNGRKNCRIFLSQNLSCTRFDDKTNCRRFLSRSCPSGQVPLSLFTKPFPRIVAAVRRQPAIGAPGPSGVCTAGHTPNGVRWRVSGIPWRWPRPRWGPLRCGEPSPLLAPPAGGPHGPMRLPCEGIRAAPASAAVFFWSPPSCFTPVAFLPSLFRHRLDVARSSGCARPEKTIVLLPLRRRALGGRTRPRRL